MQSATINLNVLPRRMITPREAAKYCGMSAKFFPTQCPVEPMLMPDGNKLYDIQDLDAWINVHKAGSADCDEDILGKLKK